MNVLESREDYLERIYMLSLNNVTIRAIDLVKDLNYSKASVSIALKKLKANNCINIDNNGHISLTEDGKKIAIEIYERHKILTSALVMLGVDPDIAEKDACKIEHDISNEAFEKIKLRVSSSK